MEERLSPRRERGLNRNTLQLFGLMFMVLGTLGSAIQLRYLNAAAAADGELLATAESMNAATMAIVFLAVQAIEIGTANFIDPAVTKKVKDGINEWLDAHGCKSVTEIIGAIK